MHEHFDPEDIITPVTSEVMRSVARVLPIELPPGVYETDIIPEESAKLVAQDILTLIEQIGYTPERVLLSGYAGEDSHDVKSDDVFGNQSLLEATQDHMQYGQMELNSIADRIARGETIGPEVVSIYQDSIDDDKRLVQLLQENPTMHQYFFGPAATNIADMISYGVGEQHPIAYAGVGGVIGLYDIDKIKLLMERNPKTDDDGTFTAYATPEEIQDALLIEYSPRFVESK